MVMDVYLDWWQIKAQMPLLIELPSVKTLFLNNAPPTSRFTFFQNLIIVLKIPSYMFAYCQAISASSPLSKCKKLACSRGKYYSIQHIKASWRGS